MNIKEKIKEQKEKAVRAIVKKILPGFHVQRNVPGGPRPKKGIDAMRAEIAKSINKDLDGMTGDAKSDASLI